MILVSYVTLKSRIGWRKVYRSLVFKVRIMAQLEVVVGSLLFLVLIHQNTFAQMSYTTVNRWMCTCSTAHQETQLSINAANCTGSCDCEPELTGRKWSCVCDGSQLPPLAVDNQKRSCFKTCNCTSGPISDSQPPRKHISSKTALIILFVCLVFTAFAFIASWACYFCIRRRFESQQILSDRGSINNSATDLIRHTSVAQPVSKVNGSFMSKSIEGCIRIGSILFGKKVGKLRGAVIHVPYSELEQATDKFSDVNLIGVGGSSHVYRGYLKDGSIVAVKRLKSSKGIDSDSEFYREVELIARLHHCHIVPLLGYCSISFGKQAERLLVFEYLSNGNLRECLDGASGKYLDWRTRISIALGAAKGLEYLHEAAAPRILHRDVKSTNILLDENFRAKVTDLGMAKSVSLDGFASYSSSPERIQGTFGYFAPEYAIVGKGSLKSDVFSFGVVLLELITGRTPIFNVSEKGEESLVMWAAPRLQNSKRVISELPDPHLGGNFPEEDMQIVAYLAKECLLLDPESRPSMSEVVQVLSTIAPDKSKRRRFSSNFLQNLSLHNARSEQTALEKAASPVEVLVDSEELRQMCPSRWSSRSLSSDADRNLLGDSNGQPISLSSVQYIDRLLYLTANENSKANGDDEIVDLTEPRLETFCVGNGR